MTEFNVNTKARDTRHLNGMRATVINVITEPDENHDWEVLPMYVCLVDGEVVEFFEAELEEI